MISKELTIMSKSEVNNKEVFGITSDYLTIAPLSEINLEKVNVNLKTVRLANSFTVESLIPKENFLSDLVTYDDAEKCYIFDCKIINQRSALYQKLTNVFPSLKFSIQPAAGPTTYPSSGYAVFIKMYSPENKTRRFAVNLAYATFPDICKVVRKIRKELKCIYK